MNELDATYLRLERIQNLVEVFAYQDDTKFNRGVYLKGLQQLESEVKQQ
jgi:hypothetical protein